MGGFSMVLISAFSLRQCFDTVDWMTEMASGLPLITRILFRHKRRTKCQLGSSNLTQKYFTMSLGYPFILGSKGQRSGLRVTKNIAGVGLCTLLCAGFF